MPSIQSIKKKITSVKSTQKITKAMKMVSAAKLKRANDKVVKTRPYAGEMQKIVDTQTRGLKNANPVMMERGDKKIEVLLITADRGLCGAFNSNIIKKTIEFLDSKKSGGSEITLNLLGRKGVEFFEKRNYYGTCNIMQETTNNFRYEDASRIGEDAVNRFVKGAFDEFYLIYAEFKSVMKHTIVIERLLPFQTDEEDNEKTDSSSIDYIYEPSQEKVLDELFPMYINIQIFKAIVESVASEQSARMTAMDSATRNAGEMIDKLTLLYNKTRQAVVTKELMDIIGGSEALRQ